MKKLNIYKTIQLVIMIVITALCLYLLVLDPDIYHYVGTNSNLSLIVGLLWAVLAITFLFLFLDLSFFSNFKRDYKELKDAAYSDSLSGIANRQRLDKIVDKYGDKSLPTNFACVMIEMTNLLDINNSHGREVGDETLKAFSGMLAVAADGICFVGRNGGNKFIAFFEDGSPEKLETFLTRTRQKMEAYNGVATTTSIEYQYGISTQKDDKVDNISELIVLANKRVTSSGHK